MILPQTRIACLTTSISQSNSQLRVIILICVRLKYEFFPKSMLQNMSFSILNFEDMSVVYVVGKVLKSCICPFWC